MKARPSPVRGPLLTFGLMIASVMIVVAVSRYFDVQQKAAAPAVSAPASGGSATTTASK
jgi:hypothetical protein